MTVSRPAAPAASSDLLHRVCRPYREALIWRTKYVRMAWGSGRSFSPPARLLGSWLSGLPQPGGEPALPGYQGPLCRWPTGLADAGQ